MMRGKVPAAILMDRGTVKFYNPKRAFGFITPDDGAKDVFVHGETLKMSGIEALEPGDRVEYEKVPDNRGHQAYRVALV